MAFPLLALGGMALAGLGRLISRRRAMRGSAFGQAMNTQATTPTNSIGTAATSQPNTAQTPAGQANSGGGNVQISPVEYAGRDTGMRMTGVGQAQAPAPQQSGGDPNLAARLGQQSIERSRRRNLDQQAPLSGQAMQ